MKLSTRDEPLGEGSCALSAHPLACAGCWVSQGLSQEAPETGCGQACPCPLHIIPGTEVGASDGIKGIKDCPDFSLAGGACIPYPPPTSTLSSLRSNPKAFKGCGDQKGRQGGVRAID